MTWVKLDDQFADHPKVLAAGPLAGWLYIAGLCYCARQLTDGLIPEGVARRLADVPNAPKHIAALVRVGLWEQAEGDYRVHDYLDYQPGRERVLATRDARADAGSRGGKQKASNLLERGYEHGASKTLPRTHTPSRTPDRGEEEAEDTLAAARPVRAAPKPKTLRDGDAARFERWYSAYPRHEKRPDAERAWSKLLPDEDLTGRLVADVEARQLGRKWSEGYIEQPATYLNQRVWEDDIEPLRAARAAPAPNGNEPAPPEYFRALRQKLDAAKPGER
jgi:hypothetical protein